MKICGENLFSENVGLGSKKLQKIISAYVKDIKVLFVKNRGVGGVYLMDKIC